MKSKNPIPNANAPLGNNIKLVWLIKDGTKIYNAVINANGTTAICGLFIKYFNPKDYITGNINITKNTRSIHHFAASWVDKSSKNRGKIYRLLNRAFGEKFANKVRSILRRKK